MCLPKRHIENQPLGQVHVMDNNHIATESIERLARLAETSAVPDGHLGMQSELICLELDRPSVLVRAVAAEDNIATVEQTLPFARTSSEWDPGWKQEGEYTGHGRVSARGVLEHQGIGEGPGVKEEEAVGAEQAKLEGLKAVGIRRGSKPGSQMSAKREGIGLKAMDEAGREANGVESIGLFSPGNGYSPEVTEQRKIDNRPDVMELADTHFLFLWPPPNRGILERYCPSEQSLERLNLQLQQQYSSSGNPSEGGKSPGKRAQYTIPIQGEHSRPAATTSGNSQSGNSQGPRTLDGKSGGQNAVKDNRTCNPTIIKTRRVIHRDALAVSGRNIGRNERKPMNEWPMVKQWVYPLRAFLWMVEVGLKRESGVTGGMEWFCRRLWDPGGRQTQRGACGVASIRELGRSVGL